MAGTEQSLDSDRVELSVSNIGGIDETTVSFSRGVTVLSGRNATNRTSLLQAIMAALGSDRATLKADAKSGEVTLEADQTYYRRLHRNNGAVVSDGEPYLTDPERADLFAFLLESNEARRAVARHDELRDLIMRPVDTAEINREIDRLVREKRDIDQRLDDLDSLESRLSQLERKRRKLTETIDQHREELEQARESLAGMETDLDLRGQPDSELADTLEDLQDSRAELERVRDQIGTERESIAALEDERESVHSSLESIPAERNEDLDSLEATLDSLRERKVTLDEELSQLQNTIQFNQRRLDSNDSLLDSAGSESVTDGLAPGRNGKVQCWGCGSTVDREQIETTVDQLRELRQEKLTRRNEIETDIQATRQQRETLEQHSTERERARDRLQSIETELESRRERLERLTAEREELAETIDDLETAIETRETAEYDAVLERQQEVSHLAVTLENKERERDDLVSELEGVQSRLNQRDQLQERREEITSRLDKLRSRIDRIESNAIEQFNEHMARLLEMLDYDNLERIWIDRTHEKGPEQRSSFELKVVRTTSEAVVYRDSVDHLSESEREVTGLVFALAGYLVHDLHEEIPFMLLDSLEAIDPARIATLVEYFEQFVPYLVVALLEEDAEPLVDDYHVVTDI